MLRYTFVVLVSVLAGGMPAANAVPSLSGALACAARLMGQPVPRSKVMHIDRRPNIYRASAATASAGDLWIVVGRNMKWSTQVHEACHRIQYIRERGYNSRSRGPRSEAECRAVALRASRCR